MAAGLSVGNLETSWLHMTPSEAARLEKAAENASGHIQHYEDDQGHPVVALSWWKLSDQSRRDLRPARPVIGEADHTDDLYFRHGRTRRRRRQPPDPAQRDLFDPEA